MEGMHGAWACCTDLGGSDELPCRIVNLPPPSWVRVEASFKPVGERGAVPGSMLIACIPKNLPMASSPAAVGAGIALWHMLCTNHRLVSDEPVAWPDGRCFCHPAGATASGNFLRRVAVTRVGYDATHWAPPRPRGPTALYPPVPPGWWWWWWWWGRNVGVAVGIWGLSWWR